MTYLLHFTQAHDRSGLKKRRPFAVAVVLMESVIASVALLICIVVAVTVARGRSLLTRIAVESVLLLAIGAFLAWRNTSPLPYFGSVPVGLLGAWARAFAVIWWLIGARLVVNITVFARQRDPRSQNARLFSDLAAAVIYLTTVMIILNSVLDLNVRDLLVTSGVIAIVLGLALQNTLADVFAGIAVGMEHPFQVGDRVSVGDGIEGVIVQINWRSVWIQTDGDDLATVPNSIVSKAPITNRSVPTRRRAVSVEIVAPAHAPSQTVIELMLQATLLCAGILSLPCPAITICRSGLSSATYGARFYVADTPDLAAAKSMFLLRTRQLFRHAGLGYDAPTSPIELLGALPPFQTLSTVEIETLAMTLIVHGIEPGDTIFEQGAAANSIYVVETGVMEASRHTPHVHEGSLIRIGAGEYIGELGLIAGAPRAFTLKALTRGRVLELPGDALRPLLQENAALSAAMKRSAESSLASIERVDAAHEPRLVNPTATLVERARAFLRL